MKHKGTTLCVLALLSCFLRAGVAQGSRRTDGDVPPPGHLDRADLRFAFGSCSRHDVKQSVWGAVRAVAPDAFVWLGDVIYADGKVNGTRAYVGNERHRAAFETQLEHPEYPALARETKIVGTWDDHDFGANDCDVTSESSEAARTAYQMFVPHYPLEALPDDARIGHAYDIPIYHAFTVGRVRFLMLDLRSESENTLDNTLWLDSNKPTMLGAAQKDWLRRELESHGDYGMMVMVSSKPWTGADNKEKCCKWMNYPEERVEVAEMIKAAGATNVIMTAGDAHMVAYDDGSNTDFAAGGGAGIPLMHSAPLHQVNSYKGGPYSEGC